MMAQLIRRLGGLPIKVGRARIIAGLSGFLIFSQSVDRPDR
jgi:hypothetical protein